MKKHNQKRKLNFDRYTVTATVYEQSYPFDVFPIPSEESTLLLSTTTFDPSTMIHSGKVKARSPSHAIDQVTRKKENVRAIEKMIARYDDVKFDGHNHDLSVLTLGERNSYLNELRSKVATISDPMVNGNTATAWKMENGWNEPQQKIISIIKVSKVENQVMKSDYIKSNSKLAKWIHKRFVKYADQLGVSVPTYYINRRDIVERMGEYAVAKTSDSGCIGRCWYGSGIIWIDVNYHDKKWGSDQKAFRKNIDHTIAHEMVHLRFHSRSDPLHVRHDGSKQRRAFDRRTNQVVRGKRYD